MTDSLTLLYRDLVKFFKKKKGTVTLILLNAIIRIKYDFIWVNLCVNLPFTLQLCICHYDHIQFVSDTAKSTRG